jgi:hypothetical protein
MFIAITFPFFGGLLGFFGGFAFAPTTYFVSVPIPFHFHYTAVNSKPDHDRYLVQLPCIMWLSIYKPKRFSLSWCTNWVRP